MLLLAPESGALAPPTTPEELQAWLAIGDSIVVANQTLSASGKKTKPKSTSNAPPTQVVGPRSSTSLMPTLSTARSRPVPTSARADGLSMAAKVVVGLGVAIGAWWLLTSSNPPTKKDRA